MIPDRAPNRKRPGRPKDSRVFDAILRVLDCENRPCKPSLVQSRLRVFEKVFVSPATVRVYLHRLATRLDHPIVRLHGGTYVLRNWQPPNVQAWLLRQLDDLELDAGAPIKRLRDQYLKKFGREAPVSDLYRAIDRLFNDGTIAEDKYRGWRLTSDARAFLS